jgi:hypothetical protein
VFRKCKSAARWGDAFTSGWQKTPIAENSNYFANYFFFAGALAFAAGALALAAGAALAALR